MLKHEKKIRVIYWIIVILGSFALGILLNLLNLSWHVLIPYLIGIAVVAIVIDMLWGHAMSKRIYALSSILYDEKDPDLYMAEIHQLLDHRKSPMLRAVLHLNLAVAWCEKKDYAKAKQEILQADPKKLPSVNELIWAADLSYICFHLGETTEALELLCRYEKKFLRYTDHPVLGPLLAVLRVHALIAEEQYPEAAAYLSQARARWKGSREEEDFEALQAQLSVLCAEPQA